MNTDSGEQSLQWSEAERMDAMTAMQDMDFSNFLDIGDLDLASFSPVVHNHQPQHNDRISNPQQHMDSKMFQSDPMLNGFGAESFDFSMAAGQPDASAASLAYADTNGLTNGQWDHHQKQQQVNTTQSGGPVYHPPQQVPPTPNSYEMHGNPGRFLQHQMDPQTRAFLESRYQLKNDDNMAFTPLVSPAVTPQESQYQPINEYTIPGAYFSPLTSPALQAQHGSHPHHQTQAYHASASTAPSSVATSPIDLNMDVDMMDSNGSATRAPRRAVRKTQAPRSAAPAARVRQSPIVKPLQKRKSVQLSSVIPTKDMEALLRDARQSQPLSAGLARNGAFADSSGTESISPEALSEALMGPPPRPASAMQSPALGPQHHSTAPTPSAISAALGQANEGPATPASLMALQRSKKINAKLASGSTTPQSFGDVPQSLDDSGVLDDLALPPAAAPGLPRPVLDRIVTSGPVSTAPNVRLTPKLAPGSTPLSALGAKSVPPSPLHSAINSPMSATQSASRKPAEIKAAPRNGKKRGSTGGPLISPAIRPKISPSIKPLLPEGANLNESQQALLLASKSNYTHILEGTQIPGVIYPETLTSGLTSKRTSHKIAEQGRRNRINDALKEMQALLPKGGSKSKSTNGTPDVHDKPPEDDEEEKGSTAEAKSASSKAATVESAIEYIKTLQQDVVRATRTIEQKDSELAALKKQLREAGVDGSNTEAMTDVDHNDGTAEVST